MVVTNRDFRPIWCPQAQFNPCVPAINVHFGIRRLEKYIVVREEPAVAIIPTAEFGKTSLDVAEVGFRQLHPYVVIVEIPERVTIDREQAVFVKSSLKVQILDPSVRLIAWQPVLFLELRPITAGDNSAHSELDPILVFFRLLFDSRSRHRFAVACVTGMNPSGGKSSRKNQHQESARGVCHNIGISS